ncbi:MAG TPA: Ig-like domain-containing protein [Mycobacteriales bacterium]|nr:Ig-like domain-containing protein [Mycobacteriales bacterium]
MATFTRRAAVLALGSATALIAGIAGPIASASATDPVTTQAAPTLLSPLDDPSTPLKDVVLTWDTVKYASSYQVQISPNGDFTNNAVNLPNNGVTVNALYEVPLSLPHAAYYWHVRALGSAGGHTAYSGSWQFLRDWAPSISILHAPSGSDPTLSWAPVSRASLYRVRFSTRPDFSGDDTHVCYTAATSFSPYKLVSNTAESLPAGDCFDDANLTDGHTYYWELIAYDDSTAPILSADTTPDSSFECAQAQPECDAAIESGPSDVFTFASQHTGTASTSTVTGLTTTWHAATLTPNTCNSGTPCPVTPTFSWDPVSGANFYRVHVYRDPLLSNTYRVYTTAQTTLTPRDDYFDAQAGTSYYWTVEAGWCRNSSTDDQCSSTPPGSQPKSPSCPSQTNATPAPSIDPAGLTPTSMAAGNTQQVTLTGSNFAASACVSASNNAGLIQNISVNGTGDTITFDYTAPESAQAVNFTVVNPDGGTSQQSPTLQVTGSFDKQVFWAVSGLASFNKQSGNVPLQQPADGASTNARSVTFQWGEFLPNGGQGAYDVRNYRVQVASDSQFDNVTLDNDAIDMNRFTDPTALLPDGRWYWRVQPIDQSGNHLKWSATHSFTKDSTPPVFTFTDGSRVATTGPLHVSVNDATVDGSQVNNTTLNVFPVVGGGSKVAGTWKQTGTTTFTFTPSSRLVPGQTYALSVPSGSPLQDGAGNTAVASSRTDRVAGNVDDKNPAWHYSSGWKRVSSSSASGGTFSRGASGSTATVRVVGSTVTVYGCKAPHLGHMRVSIDGVTKASPSMSQSFTSCGVVVWKGSVSSGSVHTLKVTAVNGSVDLDRAAVS